MTKAGILKGSASIGAVSTLERLDWHSTLEVRIGGGTSFLNLMAVVHLLTPSTFVLASRPHCYGAANRRG